MNVWSALGGGWSQSLVLRKPDHISSLGYTSSLGSMHKKMALHFLSLLSWPATMNVYVLRTDGGTDGDPIIF